MDNQHKQITGYRDLSQAEINTMNEIKKLGAQCEALVGMLQNGTGLLDPVDQRWVMIGKTHLQQGFMALVRSVAKPNSF